MCNLSWSTFAFSLALLWSYLKQFVMAFKRFRCSKSWDRVLPGPAFLASSGSKAQIDSDRKIVVCVERPCASVWRFFEPLSTNVENIVAESELLVLVNSEGVK